jgi:septum formation protein
VSPSALVLASASRIRRDLLRRAGVEVEVMPSGLDELSLKRAFRAEPALDEVELANRLAAEKALCVSRPVNPRMVIGADQLLVCEGAIFDKPASLTEARAQLRSLRGRTHVLISAIACACGGAVVWRHHEAARLTMRPFSDRFVDRYLEASGAEILESVGAYRLEGAGVQLFQRIDGDYFAILGLPLLPLLDFLRSRDLLES